MTTSELPDVHALTDEQLSELRRAVMAEQHLRRRLDASPEKIEQAISEYQQATGKGSGEAWEQPVTALQAHRAGAEVEHEGQAWVSTVANNVWEPGVSGWRLKPETDEDGNEIPPEYVQPTGAHDAYQKGERVTVDGDVYAAARDGVVHPPSEYPDDWKLIETEPEDSDEGDDETTDPDDEPEHPEWDPDGHAYAAGDTLTYQGEVYKVLQGHTSQAGWTPDAVPALYEVYDEGA